MAVKEEEDSFIPVVLAKKFKIKFKGKLGMYELQLNLR